MVVRCTVMVVLLRLGMLPLPKDLNMAVAIKVFFLLLVEMVKIVIYLVKCFMYPTILTVGFI